MKTIPSKANKITSSDQAIWEMLNTERRYSEALNDPYKDDEDRYKILTELEKVYMKVNKRC